MARREPVRLPRVRLATARPPRAGLPAAGWEHPRPAKTTGGGGTDPGAMEAAIMEALVLWYDPRRQGATNESMAADPHLKDLSGNGHDALCRNFAWAEGSGISTEAYPNALVTDGVDDKCETESIEPLSDFTIITERECISQSNAASFANAQKAFIFERNNSGVTGPIIQRCVSYGKENYVSSAAVKGRSVSWMTPTSYKGSVALTRGTNEAAAGKLTIGYIYDYGDKYGAWALWSFLLFRRTLTEQEIEWVKEHMMGEP